MVIKPTLPHQLSPEMRKRYTERLDKVLSLVRQKLPALEVEPRDWTVPIKREEELGILSMPVAFRFGGQEAGMRFFVKHDWQAGSDIPGSLEYASEATLDDGELGTVATSRNTPGISLSKDAERVIEQVMTAIVVNHMRSQVDKLVDTVGEKAMPETTSAVTTWLNPGKGLIWVTSPVGRKVYAVYVHGKTGEKGEWVNSLQLVKNTKETEEMGMDLACGKMPAMVQRIQELTRDECYTFTKRSEALDMLEAHLGQDEELRLTRLVNVAGGINELAVGVAGAPWNVRVEPQPDESFRVAIPKDVEWGTASEGLGKLGKLCQALHGITLPKLRKQKELAAEAEQEPLSTGMDLV